VKIYYTKEARFDKNRNLEKIKTFKSRYGMIHKGSLKYNISQRDTAGNIIVEFFQ